MLLISVSCDESCPTWLHPSGDGECVCDSLRNAVVCKNECKNETKVSVLNITVSLQMEMEVTLV